MKRRQEVASSWGEEERGRGGGGGDSDRANALIWLLNFKIRLFRYVLHRNVSLIV